MLSVDHPKVDRALKESNQAEKGLEALEEWGATAMGQGEGANLELAAAALGDWVRLSSVMACSLRGPGMEEGAASLCGVALVQE